ncbi:MAG: transglutaminase family protein, partial [Pseudomonadota bacterium]
MTIKVSLTHRTRYDYDRLITMGPQVVRLRPAPHSRTAISSYGLSITPQEHFLNWQQDPFGNYMARLVFPERTKSFEVIVDLVVDMTPINPFDFFLEESATETPFFYDDETRKELGPYLELIPGGQKFEALVAREHENWLRGDENTNDFLVSINQRLEHAIQYTTRMEPGVQTPEETLEKALGSCRDSSWLLVALMRRLGIAARFVSGYLIQLKADEVVLDGPSGPDTDFTDLHAWAEVYLPGAGWIGLDPTSGLLTSEGHIPLAATPSPQSAAPISGGHEACEVEFDFDMSVTRISETTRVSSPLSDDQWASVQSAGKQVDALLTQHDVRLTMGGEPTFVASSDRDAGEWNIDAVGPTKRTYADKLIRKLRDKFAPDGLLQYGQGKWYPG